MRSIAIHHRHLPYIERRPVEVHFFHLVWIFLLLSLIGLVGETIVSFIRDGRWESRAGFVFGPFSPIYGLGAVLITVFVNPLRDRPLPLQFIVGALVGGALEYFGGWFFETRYGIVAWSYADQSINFHGYTSLSMMVVWGLLSLLWIIWGLPAAVRLIEGIPAGIRMPLTVFAFVFIMADSALTLACLDSWFCRTAGLPIEGPLQQFCSKWFDDAFMRSRFETMSMWTSLANR